MDDESIDLRFLSTQLQEIIINQKAIIERLNNLEMYTVGNIEKLKNDLFFQSYQNFHTLQQGVYTISRKIRSNTKPKVIFLVHHIQAFYNIEDIYNTFKDYDEVNTDIIVINNHFKDPMILSGAKEASYELTKKGIEHITIDMENSYYALDIILSLNPDYIFIQSPWDDDRPLALKVPYLMFAKILYVPYYPITLVEYFKPEKDDLHFNSYVHNLTYRIYAQTELDKQYFKKYEILKARNVKVVGSSKLYKLKTLRESITYETPSYTFNLIWAPHHSIARRWLGFGVFHKIYKDMFAFIKRRQDIKLIYKPHPFLRRALHEHEIMYKEKYDDFVKELSYLPNVEIYEGGDYFEIFKKSDTLLTDGLSFLIEYPIATMKPLIFFDSKDHQDLNQIGKLAIEYAYIIDSFEAFENTIDNLIKSKQNKVKDIMYDKRIETLKKLEELLIPKEDPAKLILEDVLKDFKGAL